MALKKMTPQSPARVTWETSVTQALADRLECTYGDASDIIDCQGDLLDTLYAAGTAPADAAAKIDEASAS